MKEAKEENVFESEEDQLNFMLQRDKLTDEMMKRQNSQMAQRELNNEYRIINGEVVHEAKEQSGEMETQVDGSKTFANGEFGEDPSYEMYEK
jgi:hypothetical protein